MGQRIRRFFQYICKFNFGSFEDEEFKKFLRMGLIFALIIGSYWTLRTLKDAIFVQFVGRMQLPFAKTASVIALLPFVMFYTKLLEKYSKRKMLIILPAFYAIMIWCFCLITLFLQNASSTAFVSIMTKSVGYLWYLFVESFGSLVVALFWAFSSNSTQPASAKRGFPLVYAFGQMGGIILPYYIGGLPYRLGYTTDAISMFVVGVCVVLIIPCVRYFLKATPKQQLTSFQGENKAQHKHKSGFLEGLKLLLKHRYLLGIFLVNFIYEIVVTIFDFNFKITASMHYTGVAFSKYLSLYSSSVNVVSLLCLLLGISNITRFLGIKAALALMPIIIGIAFFGFLSLDSLGFLFVLMVGSKAINYALNGPALKQLYVPTTVDVRFKAQAWIETFGSRSSKQTGSFFNMTLVPLQSAYGSMLGYSYYFMFAGILCFPLLISWFVIALLLGKTFSKAVLEKRVVC